MTEIQNSNDIFECRVRSHDWRGCITGKRVHYRCSLSQNPFTIETEQLVYRRVCSILLGFWICLLML